MNDFLTRPVGVARWEPGRLHNATVMIVGVGGLGTQVALQLAQSEVGRLVLCDPDLVEESNLNRGALFTRRHIGRKKVAAARLALRAVLPRAVGSRLHIDIRADDFRYAIGLGELHGADLVLSCLDSAADRIALSSRCTLAGTRRGLLDAGLHPWGGEVRHYTADGPCYACGCAPVDRALPTWQAACGLPGPMGASAPVTAIVAALQASYALRLLFDESGPEGIVRFDAATGQTRQVQFNPAPNPDCPCHHSINENYVKQTTLSNQSTVAQLLTLAHDGEHVQSWNPIDRANPLSTLALRAAAPEAQLQALGIPPAEILPVLRVRPVHHVRYLALKGA